MYPTCNTGILPTIQVSYLKCRYPTYNTGILPKMQVSYLRCRYPVCTVLKIYSATAPLKMDVLLLTSMDDKSTSFWGAVMIQQSKVIYKINSIHWRAPYGRSRDCACGKCHPGHQKDKKWGKKRICVTYSYWLAVSASAIEYVTIWCASMNLLDVVDTFF